LNFKTFLPLYVKYTSDPVHPSEDEYTYRQEELSGQNNLRQLDTDNKKRLDMYRKCIESMDRLITVRTNIQLLRQRLEKGQTGPISAEVQVMKIGDFVLVTFPGECFAEIGLRIKKQSPYPNTFVAACTNGSVGYAPVAADYVRGAAYEDALTPLAPQWQEIYERKALELIGRLGQPAK
jgi:hypothetical protein